MLYFTYEIFCFTLSTNTTECVTKPLYSNLENTELENISVFLFLKLQHIEVK